MAIANPQHPLLETMGPVRVVRFSPLTNPAAIAKKRDELLAQLSQECRKPSPDRCLIKAYETWLRVYNRNVMPHNARHP
jgi:hypothetical protein